MRKTLLILLAVMVFVIACTPQSPSTQPDQMQDQRQPTQDQEQPAQEQQAPQNQSDQEEPAELDTAQDTFDQIDVALSSLE